MFESPMVNLYTNDIESALHFYRDGLGFVETFRTPLEGTPSHVELELDGFALGLGSVEAARLVHDVEATPGSPAMVIVLWTPDLDAAFATLTAFGAPTVQTPHVSGSNSTALLRDPDGNLVELVMRNS